MTEETNEHEYDLKKSAKEIGYLYPVLKSSSGKVIAGRSRLKADPKWPVEVRKDLDTPLKCALARLTENLHRRSLPAEEKTEDLTAIAEALLAEGFKGNIIKEIARRLAMTTVWVRQFLPDKYKLMKFSPTRKEPYTDELIKIAIRRGDSYRTITNQFGCGAGVIKRLKEEIIEAEDVAKALKGTIAATDPMVVKSTQGTLEAKDVTTPIIVDEEPEAIGPGTKITEEVMEEMPYDPLEGVTAKEISTMTDLQESLKNFQQNFDEIETVTSYGQSISGWVAKFLDTRPLDLYEGRT